MKLSYLPVGFIPGAIISLLCLAAVITLAEARDLVARYNYFRPGRCLSSL